MAAGPDMRPRRLMRSISSRPNVSRTDGRGCAIVAFVTNRTVRDTGRRERKRENWDERGMCAHVALADVTVQ